MSKIFDALAKARKENIASASTYEDTPTVASDRIGKQDTSLDGGGHSSGNNNLDKNLVTLLNPQSFEAEQFRILRTDLLFPVSGKPPRSIMVTSVAPGEGKTFVAANLAISIAQNINEHVLLMDCDLHRPCIHSRFGFNDVPGLSDYLYNGTALPSLLLKTKAKKLTILPGGKPHTNSAELLSSEKMSKLLKEVKTRYSDRYIVIDSPPPKLTSETKALATQVDGIVLVVKYGSTRLELIEELIEMMGKEKILGAVINRFDIRSSNYYKYTKKAKYSSNYYTKDRRK